MHALLRCLVSIPLLAPLAPAQLTVSSVSPARHAVGAPTLPRIVLAFGQALDPASVTGARFRVFGRWSGAMDGSLALRNGDREIEFQPARAFFPGEQVTVAASSAIRALSGTLLRGGHAWSFWVGSAPGSYRFVNAGSVSTRRNGESRIRTYGAHAGDVDRDGAPDLTLPNEDTSDLRVLLGDGCGAFGAPVVKALPTGSVPSPNEGGDFDGDGWLDLAVGCPGSGTVAVFLNDRAGGFRNPVVYPSGANTRGIAVLDVEGDGDDDIVAANAQASKLAVHRNNGDGTFQAPILLEAGTQERGVAAGDANGDGWTDLWVANFGGTVALLLADGNGGFAPAASVPVPGQPWMIAVGDVNGDGFLDAVTVNSSSATASVVLGNGAGGLAAAVNYAVGAFPIAVDLADLDGDRQLDLVVSSYTASNYTVYRGSGGVFVAPFTLPSPSAGSCALCVDYDRDGDVDILGIDELDDLVLFFRQDSPIPPGVQEPLCSATLRVDGLANVGGFGAMPAHDAKLGWALGLDVTAAPGATHVLMFGTRLEPGVTIVYGIFNLTGAVASMPPRQVNAAGEDSLLLPIPATLTPGGRVTLQPIVIERPSPLQLWLGNPEEIVLR
jgi:hypothetical protein